MMPAAAALFLAAVLVEDVRLVSVDLQPAIRMRCSGDPSRVAVYREGELTRVSLEGADLGSAFSGSNQFRWASLPSSPGKPSVESMTIQRGRGEVSLLLRLAPESAVEVRHTNTSVLLILREPAAPVHETPPVAEPVERVSPPVTSPPVTAPDVVAPEIPPLPEPSVASAPPEPGALTPEATAQLLRTLGSSAPEPTGGRIPLAGLLARGEETEGANSEELYKKLFPETPTATPEGNAVAGAEPAPQGRTLQLGFLTFRPSLRLAYVDTEANVREDTLTARDRLLQVQPGLGATATLWDGRFRAEYEPVFRGFGSYDATNATTHLAGAHLDLPVGQRFRLQASDQFSSGILEATEVDPGGEYFFNLSRFRRNFLNAIASYEMGPRWRVQAGAGLNQVRVKDPGSFFDYDRESLSAGVGFDLSPQLQANLDLVRDHVPLPGDHPEAGSTAHSVLLTVAGEVTTFTTGRFTVGYRDQDNPLAGEGGRHFGGFVATGSLTRALGLRGYLVTVGGSRATPLSAFEANGFYVSSEVNGSLVVPLPWSLSVNGGAGHRWNDYRTEAFEIGAPRADRIFEWRVGLRRSLGPGGNIGIGYERQRRRSNIDRFDTTTDGLIFQFEFNVFSAAGFR